MSLLFLPETFCMPDDIEELISTADLLQPYQGVSVNRALFNETKRVISILLKNSCISRAVNLLRLRIFDVFDEFETPSFDDMFNCLKNPTKLIEKLSPRVSQAFTLLVLNIHKNVKTFAELVVNSLEVDSSLCFIFAYSTFPAIFGYFTLDILCELAGDFLIEIIKRKCFQKQSGIKSYTTTALSQETIENSTNNILTRLNSQTSLNSFLKLTFIPQPKNQSQGSSPSKFQINSKNAKSQHLKIANPMIASFFISMHKFFHCLWALFRSKIIYQPKNVNEMYSLFCDSLDGAADYLSSHHQVVLSTYVAIDPDNCVSVIFKDVFAVSLKENFPELQEFYDLLMYLGDQPMSEASGRLFTILTKNRKFISTIPKLPPPSVIQRIPVVMSDKDICTIIEIVDGDRRIISDSKELISSVGKFFKNGYIPFYADIIVPSLTHENRRRIEVESEDTIDFKRKYLSIQNFAIQNNINELDFLKAILFKTKSTFVVPKKFECHSDAFKIYALKKHISCFQDLEHQINNLLFLKQSLDTLEQYGSYVEDERQLLLSFYAGNHVEKEIHIIDPKNKLVALERHTQYFKTVLDRTITPEPLMFFACVKLLDHLLIKPGPELEKLIKKYVYFSQHELSDRVHQWAEENSQIARLLVREIHTLRILFQQSYGMRISGILQLVKALKFLDSIFPNSQFQNMFDFVIEELPSSKVAETFITLKLFVLQNPYVHTSLTTEDFGYFLSLFDNFQNLLRHNPELQYQFKSY